LITERTPKGNLLSYLDGLDNPPPAAALLWIALDICDAMIYLGAQNIIHRDLCAKNCFVFMEKGNLLTKLGEFHLAVLSYSSPKSPIPVERQRYSFNPQINQDSPNQFAVRWTAVEALQLGEFSPASDVWSYGVLLFEIFTLGCKPYVNMPSGRSLESDEEVREFVSVLILSKNKLGPYSDRVSFSNLG
jgi:serine/threonine protein kinase